MNTYTHTDNPIDQKEYSLEVVGGLFSKFKGKSFAYKKKNRLKVYIRDKFICKYCGLDMKDNFMAYINGEIPHTEQIITIDHIIPRRKRTKPAALEKVARDWSPDNLVTSCKDCNNKKGNQLWN